MHRSSHRFNWLRGYSVLAVTMLLVSSVSLTADERKSRTSSQDELWRRTISLVAAGDFSGASRTIKDIAPADRMTGQVSAWLEEYDAKQKARRELDLADFDKYVAYAKARIERKEYKRALSWLRAANDAAEDRGAILTSDWVSACVADALAKADELREEEEWREAWDIYWQLGDLYEREVRYKDLEREVLTHLRLDLMFEKDSKWEERLDRVRWEDAREALEHVEYFYVEPANFKKMTEAGLEQLLLLAESKTAQETFDGLGNEDDRNDFESRLQMKLDQVRAARSLDHANCVEYFRRAVKDINRETVRLPEKLIVSELMRGALDTLDEFTTVIWPRESEEFTKHTRGDFPGVGIQIIKNRLEEIEVVTPLDDTPAYRAGIQAGDIIAEVDGVSLKGHSLNKVVDTITGPIGTPVTLTIRRGSEEIEFLLVRDVVKIFSVKGTRRNPENEERWNFWLDKENGIGYVRVANFQSNTVEDLENVLGEMQARGLRGLVLDLRWNPGGLLNSAWRMSSLFLQRSDRVVSTKGRIARENQRLNAPVDGQFTDFPLVVLVNEASASASEIVSGAIRDNHRGTVVGARTFGKFSVQNLIPLGRDRAKLKITTAKYELPNGDSLHREPTSDCWGVEPDIPVRLVRWERANIYQMRRESDLLGPPASSAKQEPPADEVHGAGHIIDKVEGDKPEVEGMSEKDDVGKDDKNDKDDKDDDDDTAGASWFKVPSSFDPTRTRVVTMQEPSPGHDIVDRVTVHIDDEMVDVVGRDVDGQRVSLTSVEFKDGALRVRALDLAGKEAIVASLVLDERDFERMAHAPPPTLLQPDENNRPMEDPQLDAALLLLRVAVLAESHPTLVKAEPDRDPGGAASTANP